MHRRARGLALKRAIDVIGATLALVVLSPLIAVTALAVWLMIGRPIIFAQTRPGLDTKPFALFKFRTMLEARDEDGRPLPDELRLTRLGRFLRSTSLDELPELINVLRGDMSLVGPRPLLLSYVERYTPAQARRHEVRPGLTGLAQMTGRNALSWDERFQLDVRYVEHRTTWLDVRILLKTVPLVVRRHGIAQEGHATMPEFLGSASSQSLAQERMSPGETG
jgi:sugar transferase EpsL